MLIKLFKYDFTALGRLLAPISGVLLILSAALGFNLRGEFNLENWTMIPIILGVLLLFLVFFAFMLTFVLTITRFRQNLLGNQGYLSFSLPVSTAEHITSKFLASLLWFILIGIVSGACFFIVATLSTPEILRKLTLPYIRQFLAELDLTISLTDVLITLLLSASSGLLHLYASIAIGHLWQKHSTLLGIIAYVVLSIINSRVLFYLSRTPFFAAHYTGASIAFYLVFSLIYAFICWIILERRLNLE